MNTLREKIEARLAPAPLAEKKSRQITINILQRNLDLLTQIAKAMTQASGVRVSRNSLIEDAIEVFVRETEHILETQDSHESA